MNSRISKIKKSPEFDPEQINLDFDEPAGFDSMLKKKSVSRNSSSGSISKLKSLTLRSIKSPKGTSIPDKKMVLSEKPSFRKKDMPILPQTGKENDSTLKSNPKLEFMSPGAFRKNKNVRANLGKSEVAIPEAPVIHQKSLLPVIKNPMVSIKSFSTGKAPFCCWFPNYKKVSGGRSRVCCWVPKFIKKRFRKRGQMIKIPKKIEKQTIDAYGIGIGLFFRYIKSSIYVLLTILLLNIMLVPQYSTSTTDDLTMFPDYKGNNGKYQPFKLDSIFDIMLVNVGQMGASRYRFYEFPLDSYGQKNISHAVGFDFDDETHTVLLFGLIGISEESSLSFLDHDTSCNKDSNVQSSFRSACQGQTSCTVNYDQGWFDQGCLSSKKNMKVYVKIRGKEGQRMLLVVNLNESISHSFYAIILGLVFLVVALQSKMLFLHEKIVCKHREINHPEPRDFALQIENLPQKLTPSDLKKRIIGHLYAKPEETERVPDRIMTLETERVEISNQSLPEIFAKNPLLKHGRILNIYVTSESEYFHNKSLGKKYQKIVEEKYEELKKIVDGKIELPIGFDSKEVSKKIKEYFIYSCKKLT